MPDLPPALTRQVGPFPVYGWLMIGAAGIGLGLVLRRSSLFDGAPIDADTEAAAIEGAGAAGVPTVWAGGIIPLNPGQAPAGEGVEVEQSTNETWTSRAVIYLISQGVSPTLADTAVRKYLRGEALNTAERAAIDLALRRLGPPPEGAVPITDTPAPAPVVPPKTGLQRIHVTGRTERLQNLADLFYGRQNRAIGVARLHAANKATLQAVGMYGRPDALLPPGLRLVIPEAPPNLSRS